MLARIRYVPGIPRITQTKSSSHKIRTNASSCKLKPPNWANGIISNDSLYHDLANKRQGRKAEGPLYIQRF